MPIMELHYYACDALANTINISDFDLFLAGSLYPDVMCLSELDKSTGLYIYEDEEESFKLMEKLHYSKRINDIRFSDYIGFCRDNSRAMDSSEFYRGYLFHLIFDFMNNYAWADLVEDKTDGSYAVHTMCPYGLIECENIDKLLMVKYGAMWSYFSMHRPKRGFSTEVKRFFDLPYADSAYLSRNMQLLKDAVSRSTIRDWESNVFGNEYFDNIINQSINEYIRIGWLFGWLGDYVRML